MIRLVLRLLRLLPFLLGRRRHLASAAGASCLITLDHPLTYSTSRQISAVGDLRHIAERSP